MRVCPSCSHIDQAGVPSLELTRRGWPSPAGSRGGARGPEAGPREASARGELGTEWRLWVPVVSGSQDRLGGWA